ncbi:hypothetical protein GCM10010517_58210 [Streptosporangium fragile]|uniref:Uncharacterized protein n=1 Tax=Streptosporangium fragile TaxID=46186 RepID=A0ABP6IKJ8_9ACTN
MVPEVPVWPSASRTRGTASTTASTVIPPISTSKNSGQRILSPIDPRGVPSREVPPGPEGRLPRDVLAARRDGLMAALWNGVLGIRW